MTMDFTPFAGAGFAEAFERVIDDAMQAANKAETPRDYLGGSRLGEECERKLGYEYHRAPKDEGRDFSGRVLRIFERGHTGEDNMAARLRLAGFTLLTETKDGGQFGWADAGGRIKGHADGVVTAAPYAAGVATPCLWENKVLGNKGFNDVKRKGVQKSKPVYYAQCQLYMAFLELDENPALFTVENADTGELYAEKVTFDAAAAQEALDRGLRVVEAGSPEELPRCAAKPTDFRCKWCDYAKRCWEKPDAPAAPEAAPGWLAGAASK